MMLIDPKILEQLEGSTCFGVAHDPNAKECKMCDLQQECAAKTASNSLFVEFKKLKPETEKALQEYQEKRKKKQTTNEEGLTPRQLRKKRKREERERIGMPDTKKMTMEELWELLKQRGGTCKVYDNPSVQRMRLVMAIKETYIREYEEKQKQQQQSNHHDQN